MEILPSGTGRQAKAVRQPEGRTAAIYCCQRCSFRLRGRSNWTVTVRGWGDEGKDGGEN